MVERLIETLAASSVSGERSALPSCVGPGLAEHEVEEGWPRVLPRIVVASAYGAGPHQGLVHYRFRPSVFDIYTTWTQPHAVARSVEPVIAGFHRAITGRRALLVDTNYIMEGVKQFKNRELPVSSYRLGHFASMTATEIITTECAELDLPSDTIPQISLEGLRILATREGVIAQACEPAL